MRKVMVGIGVLVSLLCCLSSAVMTLVAGKGSAKPAQPEAAAPAPAPVVVDAGLQIDGRDIAVAALQKASGQTERGWSFIQEIGKNPGTSRQVIVVVNSSWFAMSKGARQQAANDIEAMFSNYAPRFNLVFWDENSNRVASKNLGGGMEIHGE